MIIKNLNENQIIIRQYEAMITCKPIGEFKENPTKFFIRKNICIYSCESSFGYNFDYNNNNKNIHSNNYNKNKNNINSNNYN